jgi:hypothetical protein
MEVLEALLLGVLGDEGGCRGKWGWHPSFLLQSDVDLYFWRSIEAVKNWCDIVNGAALEVFQLCYESGWTVLQLCS